MPTVSDLKVVDRRSGETEIHLDGAPWLTVAPETIVAFHLAKGSRMDEARMDEMRLFDERLRARQTLARYTALALRSSGQARVYLLRRGFREEAAGDAVAYGKECGWIDDGRFAAAFVRQSAKLRPRGPRRLAAELAAKGVDPELAAQAIAQAGPDVETQRRAAERAVRKRLAAWARRFDRDTLRRKLIDYLISQGYGADLAKNAVDGAIEERDS